MLTDYFQGDAGEEENCYTTCVMPNGVMDVV